MTASETRKRKAHERAEQIRLDLQGAAVAYAKAITEKDWEVLGYPSIHAWNVAEFGPDRFSPERRKEIHALLTARGLTQRQIAKATGSSQPTVSRDQREQGSPAVCHCDRLPDGHLPWPGCAGDSGESPATPRQQAARQREERRREVPSLAEQVQSKQFRERVRRAIEAQLTGGGAVTGRAVQRRLGLDDDRQLRKVWDDLHKAGEVTVRRPQKDEPITPSLDAGVIERNRWGGPSPWAGTDSRTEAQIQSDAETDASAAQIIEQAIYEGDGTAYEIAARAVRRLRAEGLLR